MRMNRDDVDRYGYTHRPDESHDVGDAKPGDVGDSDGTFHDRARRNDHIIIGGEVVESADAEY